MAGLLEMVCPVDFPSWTTWSISQQDSVVWLHFAAQEVCDWQDNSFRALFHIMFHLERSVFRRLPPVVEYRPPQARYGNTDLFVVRWIPVQFERLSTDADPFANAWQGLSLALGWLSQ